MRRGLKTYVFSTLRRAKSGGQGWGVTAGFTIVEVTVVLAVTSLLLISALYFVTGQQSRTEFSQSINDIKQQVDGAISNVSTGFYNVTGDFTCTAPGSNPPTFSFVAAGNAERGANLGCTFIGRAMQFKVNGDPRTFNIYDVVGRQFEPGSTTIDTSQLADAHPIAFANSTANPLPIGVNDPTESRTLGYGLSAVFMKYDGSNSTAVFAAMTDFTSPGASAPLGSGTRNVLLYAIKKTDFVTNNSKNNAVDAIDCYSNPVCLANPGDTLNFIAVNNITICFKGSNDKYGVITIGTNNSQVASELKIYDKATDAGGACS